MGQTGSCVFMPKSALPCQIRASQMQGREISDRYWLPRKLSWGKNHRDELFWHEDHMDQGAKKKQNL